jgi:hypothetical protein
MKSKLTLAGSILLLAASLGQAAAGQRMTDKSYWPNEVGPMAYRPGGPYYTPSQPPQGTAQQRADSEKSFIFQAGPKINLKTSR